MCFWITCSNINNSILGREILIPRTSRRQWKNYFCINCCEWTLIKKDWKHPWHMVGWRCSYLHLSKQQNFSFIFSFTKRCHLKLKKTWLWGSKCCEKLAYICLDIKFNFVLFEQNLNLFHQNELIVKWHQIVWIWIRKSHINSWKNSENYPSWK